MDLENKTIDELLEMYETALETIVDKRERNKEAHKIASNIAEPIQAKLKEMQESDHIEWAHYLGKYLELLNKDLLWCSEITYRTNVAYA